MQAEGLALPVSHALAISTFLSNAENHGYYSKLLEVVPFAGEDYPGMLHKAKYKSASKLTLASGTPTVNLYSPRRGKREEAAYFSIGTTPAALWASYNNHMVAWFNVRSGANVNAFSWGVYQPTTLVGVAGEVQTAAVRTASANPNLESFTATTTGAHLYIMNRTGASAGDVYQDGVDLGNIATTAADWVGTQEVILSGRRLNTGVYQYNSSFDWLGFWVAGENFTVQNCVDMDVDLRRCMRDMRRM